MNIKNPQIQTKRAKTKKKRKAQKATANLTAAMGGEVWEYNEGPLEDLVDATEMAVGLLQGLKATEHQIGEHSDYYPITQQYLDSMMVRVHEAGMISPRVRRDMVDTMIRSLSEALLFASQFKEYGQPIFKLSAPLATALTLTEYDGDRDEIRLPFPSIKIKLDPGSGLSLTDENGEEDPIKEIEVMAYGFDDEYNEDTRIYSYYVIADHTFIDPPIQWDIDGHQFWGIQEGQDRFKRAVSQQSQYTLTHLIPKLLMNFSLYVQMKVERKEAGISPGPKQRQPNASGDTVYPLGREIKLPSQLKSVYSKDIEGDDEEKWKIRNRFMVRGHWREQAHGTGRSMRKRIWIQPHWKGPTTGEELERIYGVDF